MGFLWRKMKWSYNKARGTREQTRAVHGRDPRECGGTESTHLGARAGLVGAKHDRPWGLVIELLAGGLETVLKELDVSTTTVAALLVLHLVLDDERLVGELDRLLKRRGDGGVSSLGLGDEALVTRDDGSEGFLVLPLANVAERLGADGSLLGRLGGRPTVYPVVRELLNEGGFDRGGLKKSRHT